MKKALFYIGLLLSSVNGVFALDQGFTHFKSSITVDGSILLPNVTHGNCLKTDSQGNVIDSGGACGGSGGGMTPGSTMYIQNTGSLQSGSTFYVSSGSVLGNLTAGSFYGNGSHLTGINGMTSGATYYIQNSSSLQSGATFYVSSGTVKGPFNIVDGNLIVDGSGLSDLNSVFIYPTSQSLNRLKVKKGSVISFLNEAGVGGESTNDFAINANGNLLLVTNSIEKVRITSEGKLGVQTAGPTGMIHAVSALDTDVGLVVQSTDSQSANIQEWQDKDGVNLLSVDPTGKIYSPTDGIGAQFGRYEINGPTYPGLITCLTNNFVAYAPSTFQMYLETAGGNINLGSFNAPKVITYGKHAIGSTTANAQLHVTAAGESTVGQIVQAAPSQSANLQEWQNTSGTRLASIDANGIYATSSGNESTGAGSAALGANSPATTNTAPYTWIKFKTSDGSTVYVPAWK